MKTLTLNKHLTPFEHSEWTKKLSLSVNIDREFCNSNDMLILEYTLQGDIHSIALPVAGSTSIRADRLWEHTCFEAFISPEGENKYWELNVSPTGDWNFYAFEDYRVAQKAELRIPSIQSEVLENSAVSYRHRISLNLSTLQPDIHHDTAIHLGITTVIEKQNGEKSYWAIQHDGKVADFHIRKSFSLKI